MFSAPSPIPATCYTDFLHIEVALLNRFVLGSKTGLSLVSDFFLFDQKNAATVCTFSHLTPLLWKCNFHVLTEVTTVFSKLRRLEVQK